MQQKRNIGIVIVDMVNPNGVSLRMKSDNNPKNILAKNWEKLEINVIKMMEGRNSFLK